MCLCIKPSNKLISVLLYILSVAFPQLSKYIFFHSFSLCSSCQSVLFSVTGGRKINCALECCQIITIFGPSSCIWYSTETLYFGALSTKLDQFHKIMTIFHSYELVWLQGSAYSLESLLVVVPRWSILVFFIFFCVCQLQTVFLYRPLMFLNIVEWT